MERTSGTTRNLEYPNQRTTAAGRDQSQRSQFLHRIFKTSRKEHSRKEIQLVKYSEVEATLNKLKKEVEEELRCIDLEKQTKTPAELDSEFYDREHAWRQLQSDISEIPAIFQENEELGEQWTSSDEELNEPPCEVIPEPITLRRIKKKRKRSVL